MTLVTVEAAASQPPEASVGAMVQSGSSDSTRILAAYESLPLRFEANRGQLDDRVQFVARGQGYSLFLSPEGATLALRRPKTPPRRSEPDSLGEKHMPLHIEQAVIRMTIVGGHAVAEPFGIEEQSGQIRYLIGNDPERWQSEVKSYARVRYPEVVPGVDLVYYGTGQRQLEYDLVVSPGADPRRIGIAFQGANAVEIDSGGGLVLRVGETEIRQKAPVAYQTNDGKKQFVASRYVRHTDGAIGFEVGRYDRSLPLVIDPVLVYSTYLGGRDGDYGVGIAVDGGGNAYVVGQTFSTNFPTTPGAFQTVPAGSDAFVTKLTANASALVFSTYLGGSGTDYAWKVAVNGAGVYVAGNTDSANFPTSLGAFHPGNAGAGDCFVTKLSSIGSMVYSTFVGGSGTDETWGIAVDAAGNAYIAGDTTSSNFPTTPGAFQTAIGSGQTTPFVTKLTPNGSALAYSTFLGGDGAAADIAIDPTGNAYVTGYTGPTTFPTTLGAFQTAFSGGPFDAFATKLSPNGGTLLYSTFLGGSGGEIARAIAVDAEGKAYVAGETNSTDYPTSPGAPQVANGGKVDSFVTKLNAAGTGIDYSTYLGGADDDNVEDIAVDALGRASVVGSTLSNDYPTTADALRATKTSVADYDVFLTSLDATGTQIGFSTYLGGSDYDIGYGVAVDGFYRIYLTGWTRSTNYPTKPGALNAAKIGLDDAIVTKLSVYAAPVPATNRAVNAILAFLLTLMGARLLWLKPAPQS